MNVMGCLHLFIIHLALCTVSSQNTFQRLLEQKVARARLQERWTPVQTRYNSRKLCTLLEKEKFHLYLMKNCGPQFVTMDIIFVCKYKCKVYVGLIAEKARVVCASVRPTYLFNCPSNKAHVHQIKHIRAYPSIFYRTFKEYVSLVR